jgi:hypothetical protein
MPNDRISIKETASVSMEVEYSCFYKMADVFIVTEVDGIEYRNLHVSGPKEDVMAYFDGTITMSELQKRWSISKEELVAPYESYEECFSSGNHNKRRDVDLKCRNCGIRS